VLAVSLSALWGTALWLFQRTTLSQLWWARISVFCSFVLVDLMLSRLLFGFNYGSFIYVAVELMAHAPQYLRTLSTPAYLLIVVLLNAVLAESVRMWPWQRRQVAAVSLGGVIGGVFAFLSGTAPHPLVTDVPATRIAIIQAADSNPSTAFGTVDNQRFTFPQLEEMVTPLRNQPIDIIIYPFNPWSGVLGNSLDENRVFDRQVVTVTTSQFSAWLRRHIAPETLFVTWYTRYEGGRFYNEVGYWQGGMLVTSYRKEQLFPFFDFTPQWAQNFGLYSTPIDASTATSNQPVVIQQTTFGHAICSEITDRTHVSAQLSTADALLSIGSEAMFTHEIPSVFNSAQARLYALQLQKPVIRATRTGPSIVYDRAGRIQAQLRYGETGVLIFDLPASSKSL